MFAIRFVALSWLSSNGKRLRSSTVGLCNSVAFVEALSSSLHILANKSLRPETKLNMPREKKSPPSAPPKSSKSIKGEPGHHAIYDHRYSYCSTETIVKYYLFVYNIIAALGWAYILVTLSIHLLSATASPAPVPTGTKASNTLTRYLSSIPFLKSSTLLAPSTPAQIESHLPPYLIPYFKRASTAYDKVGEQTAWVQTLAVLEIVHALLGLVRSSIQTTVMQVFSRLLLVWVVAERHEVVSTSPPMFIFLSLSLPIPKPIRLSLVGRIRPARTLSTRQWSSPGP
jgi:hypothetical protein